MVGDFSRLRYGLILARLPYLFYFSFPASIGRWLLPFSWCRCEPLCRLDTMFTRIPSDEQAGSHLFDVVKLSRFQRVTNKHRQEQGSCLRTKMFFLLFPLSSDTNIECMLNFLLQAFACKYLTYYNFRRVAYKKQEIERKQHERQLRFRRTHTPRPECN